MSANYQGRTLAIVSRRASAHAPKGHPWARTVDYALLAMIIVAALVARVPDGRLQRVCLQCCNFVAFLPVPRPKNDHCASAGLNRQSRLIGSAGSSGSDHPPMIVLGAALAMISGVASLLPRAVSGEPCLTGRQNADEHDAVPHRP